MSTPSGKPPNPIDLSTYVSHRAGGRTVTERHPSENEGQPPRSPYAPKRAPERTGTQLNPAANYHDPLLSPYAPKNRRAGEHGLAADAEAEERPSLEALERMHDLDVQSHAIDLDGPSLSPDDDAPDGARAPDRLPFSEREGRDHSPNTAFEASARERAVDPEAAASLQPAPGADSRQHAPAAAERRDEIMTDYDLERLEASLRWLQRQEAATRLPRATQLPPPARGPASRDARDGRLSGERFGERFRSPLSLEPERLTPPPASRRSLFAPLAILVASIFAAAVLYHVLVGGGTPAPAPGPQMASFGSSVVAPTSPSRSQPEPGPVVARDDDPASSTQSELASQPTAPPPARSSEGERLAMLQPGPTAAPAPPPTGVESPPPVPAMRALDPAEVKLLVKQGEQFAATGDLVTARIVFQRAAEAGDAVAAMALAATYDPFVLSKLGVVGIAADVTKARAWYQKAESLGSTEAARRLRALANR